ncbi:PucR family transcriptional regulator [Lentzea chajnantorensis]
MTSKGRRRSRKADPDEVGDAWLAAVARDVSAAAGDVPVELLGDFLPLLADAAANGRRPRRSELEAVEALGRRAAELGVSAGTAVQLYLSASWRLWRELPVVARSTDSEVVRAAAEAVMHAVADAVAILADGYNSARRRMVRREEALRRELVDDLLRGDADVGGVVERAEPFGLDLTRPHQVALAAPRRRLPDVDAATSSLERLVLDLLGDRDVLVAAKDGLVVVLAPGESEALDLGSLMLAELDRLPRGRPWRVAVGRAYPGSYGIARSYEEAREALTMAARLHLDTPVIRAEQLLVYRVLVRDQPAIVDLVNAVLGPLRKARGGAEPLLATLETYFATGDVATETARQLHLSVRAVTYRLGRIKALTGCDPTDPGHRFTLHTSVLGARLLGWPGDDTIDGA